MLILIGARRSWPSKSVSASITAHLASPVERRATDRSIAETALSFSAVPMRSCGWGIECYLFMGFLRSLPMDENLHTPAASARFSR